MKKTYLVGVREVHLRFYSVQAESDEEARDLVNQRAPEVMDIEELEYSHELPKDTWSVEETPDKPPSPGQDQADENS